MPYQRLPILSLALWVAGAALLPPSASAVPLNRAVVQDLRNQVQLLLQNQPPRNAQRSDTLAPGDAVSTAQAALAELRFNDNSLARIGELTLFRFQPNTRIFQLSNGTVLLLIPPGQGRTRVQTPNAAAGIRGSALFVRYNPDTQTTLVGALTNSQIEVSNQDQSENQPLKAGQMAVIVQGKIERVYDFDLNTFYETSELVKGLDLPRRGAASADPAIAAVQAETAEALRDQTPVVGQGTIAAPAFVRLSPELSSTASTLAPVTRDRLGNVFSPVEGSPSEIRRAVRPALAEPGAPLVTVAPLPSPTSVPIARPGLTSPASTIATPLPLTAIEPPSTPVQPVAPIGSPAPLPPAPITPSPAPLPPAVEPPVVVAPVPSPAPAPLPPAVITPVTPSPAPAPLPPAVEPPVVVAPVPSPAPAPLPPAIVTAPTPPSPAPAPLPPAIVTTPTPPSPAPAPTPPTAVVTAPIAPIPPVRVEVSPTPVSNPVTVIVQPGAPALTTQPSVVSVPLPGSALPSIVPTGNATIPSPTVPTVQPEKVVPVLKTP